MSDLTSEWISAVEVMPEYGQIVLVRYVMRNSVGQDPKVHVAFGVLGQTSWCGRPGWSIRSTLTSNRVGCGGMESPADREFITHWYPFPPAPALEEEE